MAEKVCAHCNTAIVDPSSMVEEGGRAFCCNNCAEAMVTGSGDRVVLTRCAHCETPIIDTSTQVKVGDATYCCKNCSAAMSVSAHTAPKL